MFEVKNGVLFCCGEESIPFSQISEFRDDTQTDDKRNRSYIFGNLREYSFSGDIKIGPEMKNLLNSIFYRKNTKPRKRQRRVMLNKAKKLIGDKVGMYTFKFRKEGEKYVHERGSVRFILQGL